MSARAQPGPSDVVVVVSAVLLHHRQRQLSNLPIRPTVDTTAIVRQWHAARRAVSASSFAACARWLLSSAVMKSMQDPWSAEAVRTVQSSCAAHEPAQHGTQRHKEPPSPTPTTTRRCAACASESNAQRRQDPLMRMRCVVTCSRRSRMGLTLGCRTASATQAPFITPIIRHSTSLPFCCPCFGGPNV